LKIEKILGSEFHQIQVTLENEHSNEISLFQKGKKLFEDFVILKMLENFCPKK